MLLRREGTYFSRIEHGSHKVVADSNGFEVFWPSGPKLYNSARQTIMAVFNGQEVVDKSCKDPGLTFDRYFKDNRAQPEPVSIMDIIKSRNSTGITVSSPGIIIRGGEELSIEEPELGIDLNVYHKDVRRLFYAGFSRRVVRMGYNPEEVLQEIYKGILIRNNGKCPHDPRKSSLGHYVHMVAGCIISNYNRKHSRIRNNEWMGGKNEDNEIVDLAITSIPTPSTQFDHSTLTELSKKVSEATSAKVGLEVGLVGQILSMVSEGKTKSEISFSTGLNPNKVSRVVRTIRKTASELYRR